MALTHHAVVQYASMVAHGSKSIPFKAYTILGDDIVIYDKEVANAYSKLMETLGVGINASKSLQGVGYGEFCKRLIRKGVEVTGLPSNLLKSVRDYPVMAPLVFQVLKSRYDFDLSEHLQLSMVPFNNRVSAAKVLMSPLISQNID